jgi:hypothetical protein
MTQKMNGHTISTRGTQNIVEIMRYSPHNEHEADASFQLLQNVMKICR